MAEAAQGVFATAQAVRDWIEERFGGGLHGGQHVHAAAAAGDPAEGAPAPTREDGPPGPGGLAKGGLGERLAAVGLKAGQGIVWGDEMRLGLWNAVRKVWAPRGGGRVPGGPNRPVLPLCGRRPRSDDGAAVVGLAGEHEGRGDGPHLGGLGRGAGHRRLGLGRGRRPQGGGTCRPSRHPKSCSRPTPPS